MLRCRGRVLGRRGELLRRVDRLRRRSVLSRGGKLSWCRGNRSSRLLWNELHSLGKLRRWARRLRWNRNRKRRCIVAGGYGE